jgi:hypothetical protein
VRRLGVTRTVACVALPVLMLAGCGGGYTVEQTYPEPSERSATGTLTGVLSQTQECLWLIDAAGTKFELILPTGWAVAYRPIRITDPAGVVFANDGDAVRVSGPTVFGETMCASGPPFIVERIDKLTTTPAAPLPSAPQSAGS